MDKFNWKVNLERKFENKLAGDLSVTAVLFVFYR